ncbi:MAG: hypothetical protein ACE5OZ_09410, partial [Candidatus Heimdallarchaeota archaeon]
MEDPKGILAEVESLLQGYCHDRAQVLLMKALRNPDVDRATRHRFLLLSVEISSYLGDSISPELLAELKGYLKSDLDSETRVETLIT